MEFVFQTSYDSKALAVMCKALRKTTRKKKSRRSHILGWIMIALVVLLSLPRDGGYIIDARRIITWLAALAILIVFLFEDRLNALLAKKRMLPGLLTSTVTFSPDGYHSETELGSSDFSYGNIKDIAETERYFIFLFGQNHAQIYDKQGMVTGDPLDFARFISQCTGIKIKNL